jgi:GNAT superfamily N-acetyltransferase
MGVLPSRHRQGTGRRLIERAEQFCAERGMKFLTVKTLADIHPDEGYAKTRAFYRAMGFTPLEVFPLYWDESNPCLFMAKGINGKTI